MDTIVRCVRVSFTENWANLTVVDLFDKQSRAARSEIRIRHLLAAARKVFQTLIVVASSLPSYPNGETVEQALCRT